MAMHPTAIIDTSAQIGSGVSIGAYSVIGANVAIGDNTIVGAHVTIDGPTRIGCGNHIHSHAAIGGDPQDKKFHGEHSELVIGERNTIREFTTINRGTADGGGTTRIGDDNWIMAYVHIAHDCSVGSNTIFANNATLAGHVEIGDFVTLGGFSGVHQFCKIGAHAFIGMGSLINADVLPFVMVAGQYAKPRGINSEGLKRRGYSAERIAAIKRAYRALFVSGQPFADAREQIATQAAEDADVKQMLEFIDRSARSLLR
ncbi:MAG: acyl-ACP--UDP-N-acetylglucosamine O-acyltransferase [Lysobacteraceae bacterium]